MSEPPPQSPMGPPAPGGPLHRPLIELLPPPQATPVRRPGQDRPRYFLAFLLFGLTLLTTTTLGPVLLLSSRTDLNTTLQPFLSPATIRGVWSDPELLRLGFSYSIPALFILLIHELGHYLACRYYRLPATLPYFLPVPVSLGTLGAFIKIRAPIRGKSELFDVGVAGPLAGFVALLPFLLYGVARSEPAALDSIDLQGAAASTILVPGRSLAVQLATWAFHGHWLGPGEVLNLHPFALAAWFGLLATAINLIPLGQLDGGHILYAVAGRWQKRLALPIWIALALAGTLWTGWWVWCAITFAMGLVHPPIWDEGMPLDSRRRWLALAALVILALCFPLGSAIDLLLLEPGKPPAPVPLF